MDLNTEQIEKTNTINRLNSIFLFFSVFYLLFFGITSNWNPFFAILGIMFLIGLSLFLSKKNKPVYAQNLLIFATQFGNIFFGIYIGFNSGIHLYNLTAPLISFLIIPFQDKLRLWLIILLNIFTTVIQIYFHFNQIIEPIFIHSTILNIFFSLNIIATLLAIIALTYYFAFINQERLKFLHQKNESLNDSLNERNKLLAELHHRVKNNLAQISSLVNLQILDIEDEKTVGILDNIKLRIRAIALIQESYYQNQSSETFSLRESLNILLNDCYKKSKNIQIENDIKLDDVEKYIKYSLSINEIFILCKQYNFIINKIKLYNFEIIFQFDKDFEFNNLKSNIDSEISQAIFNQAKLSLKTDIDKIILSPQK